MKLKHNVFQAAPTLDLYILSHCYLRLLFVIVGKELSPKMFLKSLLKTFCKEISKIIVSLGHFIIFYFHFCAETNVHVFRSTIFGRKFGVFNNSETVYCFAVHIFISWLIQVILVNDKVLSKHKHKLGFLKYR